MMSPNPPRRTAPFAMVCVLTLTLTLGLAACKDKPAPAPAAKADPNIMVPQAALAARLTVGSAEEAEFRDVLRVSGRVEADESRLARIGASVTGRITDLDVIPGQDVKRGQLLATLHSVELSTAQLAFLKAYSQRLLAMRAAQRAEQLVEADVIGRAELQRRQSEFAQSEAEVSAARDQLMVLGMSESAVAGLTADRSVNSQAAVRASISGTVLERKVTQGQVVQPADTMFLVADLSRVWLVAEVPEQQATLIRRGEVVEAEIASLPGDRLAGTLSFIGAIVNPETRTITVRMELDNADRRFKPAMLATMFIKGRPEKRLAVPSPAIVRDENRDYVFVETGQNQYTLRLVNLGVEHEGRRHVISGLAKGDRTVVDGAFHLNNERKRNALGS